MINTPLFRGALQSNHDEWLMKIMGGLRFTLYPVKSKQKGKER